MTGKDNGTSPGGKSQNEDTAGLAWKALSQVIDPEVGIDIVNLGLVYSVEVWQDGTIEVNMTMTTKACPMSAHIEAAARGALYLAFPDNDIWINVVWEPPWSPAMITDKGRKMLMV